ncbi:hypothetical protein D0Y65_034251 [Glycine soja]|uniref:Uncharacterized protein n=1 Tax=Glycine soja TaxID=3848 RepID=A0A445HPP0_GLYSO|nr:hypothetical protein D0Y65_034251 [Glycine soja]
MFVSADNGTSHVINAYLHRASTSFNELKQLHKELGSSHSHKKHKRNTTENGNDSGKVVGNSVQSVDINKELSLGHVKFDQFKRQQSGSGNADVGVGGILNRHILRQHNIPISPKIARQHDFGKILVESGFEKAIGFVLDGCPTSTSTLLHHCFPLCYELKALTSTTNQKSSKP